VAGAAALLIFLSMLFMFFVVLSGSSNIAPLNNTYFLEADTYFISGARPVSRWTFWKICDERQQSCGASVPAMPFGYAWAANALFVPGELIGPEGGSTTGKYYFYTWRFAWVFYLMSLIFVIFAFFSGFLAFFGRLGAAVAALVTASTLFFYTLAVCLMTYVRSPTSPRLQTARRTLGRAQADGGKGQRYLCQRPQRLYRESPQRPHWRQRLRLQLGRLGLLGSRYGLARPRDARETPVQRCRAGMASARSSFS